jgi:hypothetical protein
VLTEDKSTICLTIFLENPFDTWHEKSDLKVQVCCFLKGISLPECEFVMTISRMKE